MGDSRTGSLVLINADDGDLRNIRVVQDAKNIAEPTSLVLGTNAVAGLVLMRWTFCAFNGKVKLVFLSRDSSYKAAHFFFAF